MEGKRKTDEAFVQTSLLYGPTKTIEPEMMNDRTRDRIVWLCVAVPLYIAFNRAYCALFEDNGARVTQTTHTLFLVD